MLRLFLLSMTLFFVGCAGASSSPDPMGSPSADNVRISVVAAPVCPVEKNPPDPSCAPRPLAGVEIKLSGPRTVILISNADGIAIGTLPAGSYTVTPQPTKLAMGTAGAFELVVPASGSIGATATYDTGIR
jgi:hypothetical protein